MSAGPALYTRAFARACVMHWTGAMSLSLFVLFPLYVKGLGGTETTIGLVLGLGTAASVLARPVVGELLDRVGRRRVLRAFGLGNALSWVPFFALGGVGFWLYVWAMVHMVVWGALFAAYFTYAVDLTPADRRAEGISVFGVAGMLANGLGPTLGEYVIDAAGFAGLYAVAIAFALVSTAITWGIPADRPAAPAPGQSGAESWATLVRSPGLPLVLLVTVLLGVAINAAFFYVAPFTRVLAIEKAGPFFAAYSGTSIVIRLFGRRALDGLGPHRVAVPGFALFALGLVGLAALPALPAHATLVLVACGVGCGFGHGSLFPVLNALAIARGPASRAGAVVGLHTAALDLGAVVGTPLCGVLAERAGYPAMYVAMGACCCAGLVLMTRDPRR